MKFVKTEHKVLVCCRGLFREALIYQLGEDFYFPHGTRDGSFAKMTQAGDTSAEDVRWVMVEAAPGWIFVTNAPKIGFERV